MVSNSNSLLRESARWLALVKHVIARFARGNIAAQWGRVLLAQEQEKERAKARAIAKGWRKRNQKAA